MLSPVVTIGIFQKQPVHQKFSAGEVIFEQGQPGEYMYGILEGKIDISVNGKIVETIEAGEVFGVGVLVGVNNRTYTAIAQTDCTLTYLDDKRFLFAVQETPMFALMVIKNYSERLTRLQHLL